MSDKAPWWFVRQTAQKNAIDEMMLAVADDLAASGNQAQELVAAAIRAEKRPFDGADNLADQKRKWRKKYPKATV